jgi:membrane protein YqaA with SNARE-associated domain
MAIVRREDPTGMDKPTITGPDPEETGVEATHGASAEPGGNGHGAFTPVLAVVKLPVTALRRLYNWTIKWAGTKQAPYALAIVAFAESSFFPVPPDALLIPMVVARRNKWLRNALICTLGSVAGAVLGYVIGWGFYESVGKKIVDAYDLHHSMEIIGDKYAQNAFLAVLTAAFTPIPFKVFTIGAGLFSVSLPTLLLASLVGRAGRFFMVSALLRVFGEKISGFLEKYFDILSLVFVALLIGGFVAIKYLF